MRACIILLGLMVLGARAADRPGQAIASQVVDSIQKVLEEVQHRHEQAMSMMDNLVQTGRPHPIADALSAGATHKRRLSTVGSSVQGFFEDLLGGGWKDAVPERWSEAEFDWSSLGDFDYSSNLSSFMDENDVRNLTEVNSIKDVAESMHAIETAFCVEEKFVPSEKVDADCQGPTVTIAVTPKACVLESLTKQVVCEPSKLVLTKTPGSCTHKYRSASTWTGKECKLSGSVGFTDSVVVGGALKSIPLTQVDLEYTA